MKYTNMDQIRSLYEQEIETYKDEVHSLRSKNRESDTKNLALIGQLKNLEEQLQQTRQANNDLRTAFQHIHEENIKLHVPALTQADPQPPAITDGISTKNDTGEILSWVSDRDKLNQRVKFLERECGRYQRDNTTLGKQVRHLLRALEEERGMIIPQRSQQEQDGQVVSAADVIDKHLVTFTSIEQLQQQNQQLLSIVKDLSTEQELADAKIESDEVKRLTAQVEELSNQLESIKSDRERVLSTLNTMHRERDLFKILLCKTREAQNMTPQIFQRMVSVACSSGPAIEDTVAKFAEKDDHIKDLRDINARLQTDIEACKKEMSDLRKDADQEIKLKENLLQQAHSKIIDESKRAELLNDRNQILESNLHALTSEHDELRVKCSKITFELNTAVEETEKKLAEKDQHIKDLRDVNARLQTDIEAFKKEICDLRKEADEEIKVKENLLQLAQSKILDESKRVEILKERNDLLENNLQTLTSERDELREKCSKITSGMSFATEETESKLAQKDQRIEDLSNVNTQLLMDIEACKREICDLRKGAAEEIKSKVILHQQAHSKALEESKRAEILSQQFQEMQKLRNQEREMRLDLDHQRRPISKKVAKIKNRSPSTKPGTPEAAQQEPQQLLEPEVKPAPARVITLKRRNLT